jgi:hypothetical protein
MPLAQITTIQDKFPELSAAGFAEFNTTRISWPDLACYLFIESFALMQPLRKVHTESGQLFTPYGCFNLVLYADHTQKVWCA